MTDYDDMKRGTARDWFWARIVLIGGFAIAIAIAGLMVWQRHEARIAAQQEEASVLAKAAQGQRNTMSPEQARADESRKMGMMICAMELLSAKNMGLIPPYGELADSQPRATNKKNRVSCLAATEVNKYQIQADLFCRTLTDSRCMKLHSVKTDHGTTLYEDKN
jgi:hypothetical protein